MISRRFVDSIRRQDWFVVATDFLIVVLGIFIGLQASLWVQTRQDVETERRYHERLLADSDENVRALEQAIGMNDRRAATLSSLAAALENGGPAPSQAELSNVMCRWFIQPAVNVRRGTYVELVSSGRLALVRDEDLRSRLALEQAAHDEAERLDILAPAVFQAAAPLADYREWRIVGAGAGSGTGAGASGVDCNFNVAGMRADKRIPSVVAQLYRDQATHKAFRQRELDAVRLTRTRLSQLLGRRSQTGR
jgi:hypothetical protein